MDWRVWNYIRLFRNICFSYTLMCRIASTMLTRLHFRSSNIPRSSGATPSKAILGWHNKVVVLPQCMAYPLLFPLPNQGVHGHLARTPTKFFIWYCLRPEYPSINKTDRADGKVRIHVLRCLVISSTRDGTSTDLSTPWTALSGCDIRWQNYSDFGSTYFPDQHNDQHSSLRSYPDVVFIFSDRLFSVFLLCVGLGITDRQPGRANITFRVPTVCTPVT